MKHKKLAVFLIVLGCSILSTGVSAHHGASRWDVDAWGTVTGTVKEFDWQNPHPLLLLEVKNDKGDPETWAVEFHPPNVMSRGVGWSHNTFKPGDQVTVEASRAKDGCTTANARSVKLPDGRRVFGGSSGGGGRATRQNRVLRALAESAHPAGARTHAR